MLALGCRTCRGAGLKGLGCAHIHYPTERTLSISLCGCLLSWALYANAQLGTVCVPDRAHSHTVIAGGKATASTACQAQQLTGIQPTGLAQHHCRSPHFLRCTSTHCLLCNPTPSDWSSQFGGQQSTGLRRLTRSASPQMSAARCAARPGSGWGTGAAHHPQPAQGHRQSTKHCTRSTAVMCSATLVYGSSQGVPGQPLVDQVMNRSGQMHPQYEGKRSTDLLRGVSPATKTELPSRLLCHVQLPEHLPAPSQCMPGPLLDVAGSPPWQSLRTWK